MASPRDSVDWDLCSTVFDHQSADQRGGVDAEKPPNVAYCGGGSSTDPFVVVWDKNDPENPYNWSKTRKWILTAQVSSSDAFSTLLILP